MQHNYFSFDDTSGRRDFALPGAKPQYVPDRPGQVCHIVLDLTLDLPGQRFAATCTLTLQPVCPGINRLELDAVGLQIRAARCGDRPQPFRHDGERLIVELLEPTGSEAIELAIDYSVERPQRGLYFIAPTADYPDKPTQVWTQGEDEDSRYWFPCFDYPGQLATSEIRVRVPKPLQAISNGELVATEDAGEATIYHWRQAEIHPTYLMTLAVGDFAELADSWDGIPVTYYVEKGREADAQRTMGKTPRMVAFFSAKYGYRYAFPKYAQVCVDDFIFGGMENTSTTLLTDRCLLDERAQLDSARAESLVAHELAHQWFGDLVVIEHWSHAWLKEGMASYAEVLWWEHEYGSEAAAYYMLGEARSYLSEDSSRYRRPIVTNIYREAIELYDRHLYEKGACVYRMIRAELGDEQFDAAMQTFVRDNAHSTVATVDLLRAIDKATGRNLAFLFDQYVFRGGHPDFKIDYSWDSESNLAKLAVTQTQAKTESKDAKDKLLFDLRLPITFWYGEGEAAPEGKTFRIRVNEPEQSFYFPLEKQPKWVTFDTGNGYLKTVTLTYPLPELKAQLQHDRDPVARIYAAEAIAKQGSPEALDTLIAALETESFWGVRVEIVRQLADIKGDRIVEALSQALKTDTDARVRRAILETLSKFKTAPSYEAIAAIARQGDPSYYTEATALRVLAGMAVGNLQVKQDEILALLAQALAERAGWNEVVRGGAIGGLAKLKDNATAAETILRHTKIGVPQPLRLAAIRALGPVSAGQEKPQVEAILDCLDRLTGETFFLTQVAVVAALKQIREGRAISILQTLATHTTDGRVRRIAEEGIASARRQQGSEKTLKKLQADLDTLKQENLELRDRLDKLETRTAK
ncbi:MAG: M1 family metallopeptidase [Cyanobacteria bacterium J06641_5]